VTTALLARQRGGHKLKKSKNENIKNNHRACLRTAGRELRPSAARRHGRRWPAAGHGIIDASEIANAPKALLKADKNGDGKLSAAELKPELPSGFTPPEGMKIPTLPIMVALDTNGDGELDAGEIANVSAALKTLDANHDGQLTRDEILPKFPGGPPPDDK
jgi:hypothetical protein